MKKSPIAKKIRSATLGRLILLLVVVVAGVGSISPVRAEDQGHASLSQFDLLTGSSGWVLLDGRSFRTSDAGQTWDDISPALPSGGAIRNVHFMDSGLGWVLFTTPDPNGGALFHLAHTTDDGGTWTMRALSLFESGEIASFAEKTGMGWLDVQTGWISVKQASGSNFSIGALFTTSDGGVTWSRFVLPVADRIAFSDSQTGWAAGGPTGDQVFKTQDGGLTWQNISPDNSIGNARVTAYAPFVSSADGLLVTTSVGAANSLNVYRADSSSDDWSLAGQVPLDTQPGLIGLSIIDTRNFVAVIPGMNSIVRMKDGSLDVIENQDGLSDSITALDMASLEEGWAKSVESDCVDASSPTDSSVSVTCSSTTRFLRTTDGGVTWQSVPLPSTAGSDTTRLTTFSDTSRITTMNSLSNLGNSTIFIGQGFDACEIPTLSQMQTWALGSPYEAVNLYIGGSSRACDNAALTADYLKQLHAQGWKFIPTWVGPQAPCTGYLTKMSSDPAVAYTQGVAQADLAVERLAELGLTFPDKTGSVVYYDIEYYGTNIACRNAVNSFMNGWVSQIHARGNLAGVYATHACDTGLNDFRTITNVPDVVWIAGWYYNVGDPRATYDPTASVWDWLSVCMVPDAWANHQRIRQYAGDHDETWGGLTLEIDNDVLDGVVANAYMTKPPQYEIPTPVPPRPRPVLKSQALTPVSLTTDFGTTSGSLSSLSLLDQTGVDDDPAAYVSFQTPSTVYLGYQSFTLPSEVRSNLISTMLLQVNFKGSVSSTQTWTWSIYDRQTGMWIKLGDSIGANTDQWRTLLFRIRVPHRYILRGREIHIQLKSNNSDGDAKMDYEGIHITYLSIPAVPTPVVPTVPPKRPGIFSVPATPGP
jgi:photosystem II stability/assembly factor-like uncharacterized protein